MKTMRVCINVPDWVTKNAVQHLMDREFSPDWMSLHWHISDVQDCAGDCTPMSDDDARHILEAIHHQHDTNNGVNWDTINHHVGIWREHQEGESC